jgi:hypothetical protein
MLRWLKTVVVSDEEKAPALTGRPCYRSSKPGDVTSSSLLDDLGRVLRVKAKPAEADRSASLDTAVTARAMAATRRKGRAQGQADSRSDCNVLAAARPARCAGRAASPG